MKTVLIIIPTYNEAENIEKVVTVLQTVGSKLRGYHFQLLIVDDNSPDGTATIVRKLKQQHKNIDLLLGQKAGLGKAYLRGFEYALDKILFDICIMMDADLSHSPHDIPALLLAVADGADYVIGSRYIVGGAISNEWPRSRILTSYVANMVAHKLAGIPSNISDTTSGFKAIRRSALEQLNLSNINAKGYIFQVSLLHAVLVQQLAVQEVPIGFTDRQYGKSKIRITDILEFVYRAYKLNPSAPIQRLARFGAVGACGTLVNLAILVSLVKLGHVAVLLSGALAIEASILFNFSLNHLYTFKGYGANPISHQRTPWRRLLSKAVRYNFGTLIGAIISFTVFSLLFKTAHMQYVLADIIAVAAATSWNYWVSVRFVWEAIKV